MSKPAHANSAPPVPFWVLGKWAWRMLYTGHMCMWIWIWADAYWYPVT